ncbi:flagellar biosynthetic protein FliO [Massilia sp. MB5]|uniref:flagellar biosynthetic protein FliO n=1 Tax=Massilia sp. MB5 TaxID=2919578 RepID=UPI001F0DC082|nr:flagellar biosynthetic protein FliO [Massilia sp. MB5]UMR30744.1 flagellar biosynthetic protein FliO [Massilia sp. MB5]
MKPGFPRAALLAACCTLLLAGPAPAQHSASGTIAAQTSPAPAAAGKEAGASGHASPKAAGTPPGTSIPATAAANAATAPADSTATPASGTANAAATAPAAGVAAGAAADGAAVATPEQQAALAGARPAQNAGLAPTGPSAAGSLLQTTLALAVVLGLLVGLAWLLKRFGPRSIASGNTVKLVGALSVGARERILVVEVGEQWIVVGASPGRMNALASMPRQEGVADALPQQNLPGANFAEWFKQTIDKRNDK